MIKPLSFSRMQGAPHPGFWVVLALLVLAAVAGGLYYFLMRPAGGGPPEQAKAGFGARQGGFRGAGKGELGMARPVPVVAEAARSADVGVYVSALGSVTPLATVTVRSRVDGELRRILFREGQMVRAGDLLAEIDPRSYQVQLAQAEAQMQRDQALLKNAQIDVERYRKLFRQDSIARQQLDTQEALVRQYEGTVKVDQALIDNARLQLSYCRITAPISGRLGLRQVDAGNMLRANDANGVVLIAQLQPISVVFAIPEDNLPMLMRKLRAGERLTVDVYDRADKVKLASGMLITADNQVDPATGTVRLKAQFTNRDLGLFPNQFVNVRLLLELRKDATMIPAAAVQRGTPGTFVYVVKEDRSVELRPVKLGPAQDERIAIDAGLAPGELVVVDGADKLRAGTRVDTAGRAPPGAPRNGAGRKGGGWRGPPGSGPPAAN
ncbi:MAG: MdtA/MuxA family multidrug efflux RND transporter periplasmic adaptor subunit [Betaproteobacteria bacterium]|nr:MdtA/MuxA family multidrug efflux RND transporter periplasmic adaptor subunit [Betaproteobacteria bacterium]